jgi:hypothetical protein
MQCINTSPSNLTSLYCFLPFVSIQISLPKVKQIWVYLTSLVGIRFFRCTNEDVEQNLPEVLEKILEATKD